MIGSCCVADRGLRLLGSSGSGEKKINKSVNVTEYKGNASIRTKALCFFTTIMEPKT